LIHRAAHQKPARVRGHGRIEIRTLKAVSVRHFGFPHAAQVVQVTGERQSRNILE
jgi:hypothetical protein